MQHSQARSVQLLQTQTLHEQEQTITLTEATKQLGTHTDLIYIRRTELVERLPLLGFLDESLPRSAVSVFIFFLRLSFTTALSLAHDGCK